MALSLPIFRIRLQSDYLVANGMIDASTRLPLRIPILSDVRFECGIFGRLNGFPPNSISQVPNPITDEWQSLTLRVQSVKGVDVITEPTTDFTNPTFAGWLNETQQHAVIDVTNEQTDIPPGVYNLALQLITVDGMTYPIASGIVEFYNPGHVDLSGLVPTPGPGVPITLEQADARYALIGSGGGSGNGIYDPDVTSWADLAALTTDPDAPGNPEAEAGDVKQFVVAGSLKTVQLTASVAATNIPFTQRPDDYDDLAIKLVWFNIG